MKKTDAGILWFGLGVFLIGVGWTGRGTEAFALELPMAPEARESVAPAAAESAAPAATESTAPAAAESIAESAPRLPAGERLEALKSADLAELKAAQEDCLKAAVELTEKVPELREQMRAAYEDARKNSPEIKALQQQIRDVEAKMEQTLRETPAVKEKMQAIEQAQADMMAELQLRTRLAGMIAAKEAAAPAQISEE